MPCGQMRWSAREMAEPARVKEQRLRRQAIAEWRRLAPPRVERPMKEVAKEVSGALEKLGMDATFSEEDILTAWGQVVPPIIAMSELIATSPVTDSSDAAVMTLKPNQPMQSIHEPSANQGIDDGGIPTAPPSFLYRPRRGPRFKTAASAIHPPTA